MSVHTVALVLHLFVARLGVGSTAAVAMVVTGAVLEWSLGGPFHDTWWFRGSVLLLVATGFLNARARRALANGAIGRVG